MLLAAYMEWAKKQVGGEHNMGIFDRPLYQMAAAKPVHQNLQSGIGAIASPTLRNIATMTPQQMTGKQAPLKRAARPTKPNISADMYQDFGKDDRFKRLENFGLTSYEKIKD